MKLKDFIKKLQKYEKEIISGSPHRSCGNIQFWLEEPERSEEINSAIYDDFDLEFTELDITNTPCGCECDLVVNLKLVK